MILTGSTWVWSAYGVTVIGFILPSLQTEWGVSSSALGFLAGIGMLGMLIGAVVAGSLSDRFGRSSVLTWNMVFLGIMFLGSTISENYGTLLVFRFLTGVGLGANLPVAGTLVSEFSPSKHRGTMMVLLNGFWGLGGTLAALIGYSMVLKFGWRPAMMFGGLAIIFGVMIHFSLPESVRFLLDKGREDEAYNDFNRIHVVMNGTIAALPSTRPSRNPANGQKPGIWSRRYSQITFSIWVLWISLNFLYQGVFVWLPTLLAEGSSTINRSFLLTLFISLGQIPGTFLIAYLADRYNRKRLIIISLGLHGLTVFLFSFSVVTAWIISVGFLLMLFNGMAWGLAHPFSAELYPTSIRGTATGWATGIGRLGGVVSPLVVASVLHNGGGVFHIFSILAATPVITMLFLAGLKQETSGRSLEEIAP